MTTGTGSWTAANVVNRNGDFATGAGSATLPFVPQCKLRIYVSHWTNNAVTFIFAGWIANPAFGIDPSRQGLGDDPDGDGIPNGVENFCGTDPGRDTEK